MALNYAEQWSPELLEILMQGTLTSPFVTSNVRWLDAKTFHFTQMSTSGYKNHSRKGGWNVGSYEQKDVPYYKPNSSANKTLESLELKRKKV